MEYTPITETTAVSDGPMGPPMLPTEDLVVMEYDQGRMGLSLKNHGKEKMAVLFVQDESVCKFCLPAKKAFRKVMVPGVSKYLCNIGTASAAKRKELADLYHFPVKATPIMIVFCGSMPISVLNAIKDKEAQVDLIFRMEARIQRAMSTKCPPPTAPMPGRAPPIQRPMDEDGAMMQARSTTETFHLTEAALSGQVIEQSWSK